MTHLARTAPALALSMAMGALACTGTGTLDPGDGIQPLCGTPQPGETPIRRLSRSEFRNTVRDLFGEHLADFGDPTAGFPPEEKALGFDNNAYAQTVSPVLAESYMKALEQVSAHVTADAEALVGCDPATEDAACVRDFLRDFGLRAWRRPLTEAELAGIYDYFLAARAEFNPRAATRLVLERLLQSPYFLYRVEDVEAGAGPQPATPWELASRLSYLLWNSMPDDELLRAAAAGELARRAEVEAQARRMLADPDGRHREAVANFHEQWLSLGRIASVEKDADLHPGFDEEIAYLLGEEAKAFFDRTIWDEGGGFGELMTGRHGYVDPNLAAFYGLELPEGAGEPADGELVRVDFDSSRRAGFLTLAGLMAENANSNQTNPVTRGHLVREQIFCQVPTPAPDDVDIMPPDIDPDVTGRERWAQHSQDPACSGCHQILDPIGFGFENFDAAGQWRDTEAGAPIDASGELVQTDVDGTFVGPRELAETIADSRMAKECFVTQWFRFGYGRGEGEADQCNRDYLSEAFVDSGGDVRELLVALTQTDTFLYKNVEVTQ